MSGTSAGTGASTGNDAGTSESTDKGADTGPSTNPGPRFVVVAKRDCPTCVLVQPVLREITASGAALTVYAQDDPMFPDGLESIDDRSLEHSWRLGIETVPTLIRIEDGHEAERTIGWDRAEWCRVTELDPLGAALPDFQPGCGSKSVDPGMPEVLEVAFGAPPLTARRLDVHAPEDEHELCFSRGWSDGLPVVPPTPVRVLRMLKGTTRDPQEVVGPIPPNNAPCTVEKVAINAVMAGCKPEYMPVVLAVVEAALVPEFTMHGLLCTTYFSGPMVVVNGPVARRIGMNSGVNALGQGNRANASIGRALQLVIRNVGGGVPGGIDRATLGWPGKYTLCFAEDESDPGWLPLSVERGVPPGASAVTLFAAGGLIPNMDEGSRTPESLTRSLAMTLNSVGHPKVVQGADAFLILSPEHWRIFREGGWDKARIKAELMAATVRPGAELVQGANGIDAGVKPDLVEDMMPKFRDGGLNIVRAGGEAGLMSAVIGGWVASGPRGSSPVTRKIGEIRT
ncbi:MAG: thioredoxin family protein [Thiotrichales bacterium]|nr:thioredoxin family protein [Thiotrichales bacterium]